jgi:hypothetical protein
MTRRNPESIPQRISCPPDEDHGSSHLALGKRPKRTNRNKAPFTDGEELTIGDTQYAGHRVRGIELGAASSAFRKERARRNVLVGIRPERPAQ